MKIAWVNHFDTASIEAGTNVPNLAPQHLKEPQLGIKWFTTTGSNSDYILSDFGSAKEVRCVAVLGTNFTSAATIRVRGSNTDNTAQDGGIVDTGVVSSVTKTNYGSIYYTLDADYTARYWRVDLADSTVNNLRVGRLFIGPAWTPTKSMLFGWSIAHNDASRRTRSLGGALYVDESFRTRTLDFTLSFLSQTEMYTNPFEMMRANGLAHDILVIPEESGAFIPEMSIWGTLASAFPLIHQTYQVYRQRYRVEERI